MIGRIKTLDWTAELGDDGVWTCAGQAAVAAHLNALYRPTEVSPADGTWGVRFVLAAASAMEAEVELPSPAAHAEEEPVY